MMDETRIIEFLCNQNMSMELQKQAYDVRQEIKTIEQQHSELQDEILHTIQTGVHYQDTKVSSGGRQGQDLESVLYKSKKMLEEHLQDLYVKHQNILDDIETNHRLQLVFDTISSQYRELLLRMYRDGEKWDVLELEMDISRSKLARIRNQTIKSIETTFNSTFTNRQLAKLKSTEQLVGQTSDCESRQLSLLDL